jgi:Na+-driven multidrug efflux pump
MQKTTNDMTQGNSMKLIFQFFLPILIGNLFQQLYSFVDSMVVGKGIGDVALAAVGNTSSVHFLILGFAMGLTGGLGICISHSFGANDIEKLRKEIAMSVYICLAIGIVITSVLDAPSVCLSPDTGGYDDRHSGLFWNHSGGQYRYHF